MTLKQSLFENKQIIDEFLLEFLSGKILSVKNQDNELATVLEVVKNQILRSGKRIRPFVLRQAYLVCGGKNEDELLKLGASLELLHQYFLIHDDIVDRDEKRYGEKSLHKYFESRMDDEHFGLSIAMIAGDYINSLTTELVINMEIQPELKMQIIERIIKTIQDTTSGWQLHFFQNRVPISQASRDRYLKGMELVSAKYTFENPILLGMFLSENREFELELKRYAFLVGMAYQIQDDVLGVFGNTEATGKPSGNDIREGKKTLLILEAYKNSSNEQKLYIEKHLGNNIDQQQVDELRDIIVQTGAKNHSEGLATTYSKEAKEIAQKLDRYNNDSSKMLYDLADFVINRDK